MSRKKKKLKLTFVFLLLGGMAVGAGLTLWALQGNMSFFRTPTEIVAGTYPEKASGRGLRLGGLVEQGSLRREGDVIIFSVTDNANHVTIRYRGVPPDLFREGQCIVAEGKVEADGTFIAANLLAKHDETYMPPEVADAMKKGAEKAAQEKPTRSSDKK